MNKKLKNKLKRNIRVIPDFPKKGILFQDITSITDNKLLFKEVVDEISKYVKKNKFTKIAAVEARGFILAQQFHIRLKSLLFLLEKKENFLEKYLSKNINWSMERMKYKFTETP